jgi:hypothetical protein
MLKRFVLAWLAVTVLTPGLWAQQRRGFGGPVHLGPGFGGGAFTARSHSLGSRGFYLGDTPYFYTDYPFQQFAAEPASPEMIVMRPPAEETKSEPLLIELRGDRYVRFGGIQKSSERGTAALPDYAETSAGPVAHVGSHTQGGTALKSNELPPVVLVYRDGRQEEVSDYAIVGTIMYARGDYWKNGYWTKNIQLSALNISATMKANQDNGVKFVLPAGPNEVVTRP